MSARCRISRAGRILYSKVMCWVALDRAIALADRLDAADRVDGWKASRDEIFEMVVREGWNEEVGAFTQYEEGTFLLCTFWLAQALAMSGQVDRATEVFGRAVASSPTSGSLPRRSTARRARCWATCRGPSATSAWSTPPGRSPGRVG